MLNVPRKAGTPHYTGAHARHKEVPGKEFVMETRQDFRSGVGIPVLETTSAFARGVTLTEAFRLWQAHDRAAQIARMKGGMKAPLNVYAASMQSRTEHPLRQCA
jgi:hypothetical protein